MVKKRTDRTNDKKKSERIRMKVHTTMKKRFFTKKIQLWMQWENGRYIVFLWFVFMFFIVFFFCFLLTKDYFLFIYCYYSFVFNIFCLRYSLFTYFTYFFNVWFLQQWERNICPIQEICVQLPWRLSNVIVFSKSLLVHFAAR